MISRRIFIPSPLSGRFPSVLLTLFFLFFQVSLTSGQVANPGLNTDSPFLIPTITGPTSACAGTGGYLYSTETGMNGYSWSISAGGTITSGAGTSAILVTWNVTGAQSLSVTYNTATGTGIQNVTVSSPVVSSITIAANANSVCEGTVVSYTSTIVNGGAAPIYQWKVNGINIGSNIPTCSYTPSNGDIVTCELTSSELCANATPTSSNAITMVVIQNQPVSVAISASSNPVCQGTTVNFSATPSNGGANPTYQWLVNGVPNGIVIPTFSYIPTNGEVITCIMTSTANCTSGNPAVSNPVTMSVSTNLPVGVTISAASNPSCESLPVAFTAVGTNAGATPSYQWRVNGVITGTNASTFVYPPVNGDVVTCTLTSSLSCTSGNPATSSNLSMTVTPSSPVSVSITPSQNPACQGSAVTLTATPVNGGTSPIYLWYLNGFNIGATGPTYTTVPANGDVITCQLVSNAVCPVGSPAFSNPVTMVINPLLSVNVSIVSSENPVCQGTNVTFTATPYNGGPTPFYQWKVNGVIVGSNSTVFSYVPMNNDLVTCEMTTSVSCAASSTASSNSITMSVSPLQPVSVSIAVSANPICQGTPVTCTAIPVNGGITPSFQWMVNGFNVGGNASVYTYTPLNNDLITCQLISSTGCSTGSPATSNGIVMGLIPTSGMVVGITITGAPDPSCQGQTVNFTANPVNEGLSPTYQWIVNGINVGSNSPTYSYIPSNGNVVQCQLTSSYTCPIGNPALSNLLTMTVDPNLIAGVTITATANPVCQGSPATFTATPINGGASPSYQWTVNGVPSGATTPVFTYTPTNGDVVRCIMTSSYSCPTGNPATSNAVTVQVNPNVAASVTITASSNPVCQGNNVTLTATPTNGGTAPFYQWKKNGLNVGSNSATYIYTPVNGDVITCQLTSNYLCLSGGNSVLSNTIILAVTPLQPVSVSVSPSVNPACAGNTVTFTATPVNGGTSPIYSWRVNGISVGGNSSTYSYIPLNGDIITCRLTSNALCVSGNPATSPSINMTIYPVVPATISISTSTNPFCAGTMVDFSSIITNGGTSPTYQWMVNGINVGSNSSTFSYTPADGEIVTCHLQSNSACISGGNIVLSNEITMNESLTLPVDITITASSNPSCLNSNVTFTAVANNAGTLPVFQWKRNGLNVGTNSSTYSLVPTNGDIITCELTSNLSCASGNPAISNPITMVVNPLAPVTIVINTSGNPACQGQPVTFTSSATNEGSAPVYQWRVNGINAGTGAPNYTYNPINGDAVTCRLTSNASCATGNPATSNLITMQVFPTTSATVTISSSANPSCQGNNVIFTATPFNGGPSPVYQWKVNGANVGTNNTTYSYTPVNGDQITCIMMSNSPCTSNLVDTSNLITMTVNPVLPVSVTITPSINPVCQGNSVTLSATPLNGGTTPVYQWRLNGVIVGANSSTYSYTPVTGDNIVCRLTSNATCISGNPAMSNTITMAVSTNLPPTATISVSANPVCDGTLTTFTASVQNCGITPIYQWKVNGVISGTSAPTFTYIPLNGDVVNCQVTSTSPCSAGTNITTNSIGMMVSAIQVVSISIAASANPVCNGSPVTFTATPFNGGSSPSYQWKVNSNLVGTNSNQYTYFPVNGDSILCTLISPISCLVGNPANSNLIVMGVGSNFAVNVTISSSTNPVCQGQPVTYTALGVNGGTNPQYLWMINGINVGLSTSSYTTVPSNGDLISCEFTSDLTCVTGNPAISNTLLMNVEPVLPAGVSISSSSNPVCSGIPVTYTASPVNGGVAPTYQWLVNGVVVGSSLDTYTYTPTDGDVVSCEMVSGLLCSTGNPAVSNPIIMSVFPTVNATITITESQNNVCEGIPITFTATIINGGSIPFYQWRVNGVDVGTNQPELTWTPVNNDIITCQLVSNATCLVGNPVNSNQIVMNLTPVLPVSVVLTSSSTVACQGIPMTFTATVTNGGISPMYEWFVNRITVGSNSPTYTYDPSNGDSVICRVTSDLSCVSGNPATTLPYVANVSPLLPVSISIVSSNNPSCAGSVVTYTATPVNGGLNPQYQWEVNGVIAGSNSPLLSYVPVNGDVVTCQVSSSLSCISGNPALSNTITMIVSDVSVVGITISATNDTVCSGTLVTFFATHDNEGTTPFFQWSVNGINVGLNDPIYSYLPLDGDIVQCSLTSSMLCVSGNPGISNAITLHVDVNLPVGVTMTSLPAGPVCEGTSVLYTVMPLNGGLNPTYQWFVNGIPAGSGSINFTHIPVTGDVVKCTLGSSEACVLGSLEASDSLQLVVQPFVPAGVSITCTPSATVCPGATVQFTAVPTNGGLTPAYQWKVNGMNAGLNNPVFDHVPLNGDIVTCTLTSSFACVTGNPAVSAPIVITYLPVPAASFTLCSRLTSREGKPIQLKGGVPGGGAYSGVAVTAGWFYPNLLPLAMDSSVIRYTYTAANGCKDSASQYIVVTPVPAFTCGGIFTDIRDNAAYSTFQAGAQCWFSQNLNFGMATLSTSMQRDNCIMEKYCYGDLASNCNTFGGLYQWDELMQYADLSAAQGFCPPGWHIPTEAEWSALFLFLGGNAYAGDGMKLSNAGAFTALPTGIYFHRQGWNFTGFSGFFWSSTSHGPYKAWGHAINTINHGVATYPSSRVNAFSIRCIHD